MTVAINDHLGGEGPPPDLEIKVGRFGKTWQVWGKSWQVGEQIGRFMKKVGRLGKKLAGLRKKMAGWGKSWQVGEKVGRLSKKLAGLRKNSWQVEVLEIRSWQVVKGCQIIKVCIWQVITN